MDSAAFGWASSELERDISFQTSGASMTSAWRANISPVHAESGTTAAAPAEERVRALLPW
jgi:hypothetical protein